MNFADLARSRYSVRAYKPDPVEDEKLQLVMEAARLAPTAANRQPIQFIIVHTKGKEDELRSIYKAEWFVQAPLVICACGVPTMAWTRWDGRNYTEVDVAIAMDHLILQAADLGLGTCWIAAFEHDAARAVLELPESVDPIAFTPLGYPADAPGEKRRKAIGELLHYERW
jgi:nitroreductase